MNSTPSASPARRGPKLVGSEFLAHPRHGPLPALLLVMTFGTGVVDAVSILGLGRVFIANMTGNVAFIGFGLAGAPGFSISGSLIALIAFVCGAIAGGVLIRRHAHHRGLLLQQTLIAQLTLFLLATACSIVAAPQAELVKQGLILGLAALALGLQNAAGRHLAVPDMTTTVLTMTLTGIGADLLRGDRAAALRRGLAVAALLLGAVSGGTIVLSTGLTAGLITESALVLAVLVAAVLVSRGSRPWHTSSPSSALPPNPKCTPNR